MDRNRRNVDLDVGVVGFWLGRVVRRGQRTLRVDPQERQTAGRNYDSRPQQLTTRGRGRDLCRISGATFWRARGTAGQVRHQPTHCERTA